MSARKIFRHDLETAIAKGMTRKECAAMLGVDPASITLNIKAFGLDWPHAPSGRAPGTVRKIVPVDVKPTIRETAIANRGRASASVIADAVGVTRNSIIGHWTRARQSGDLVS